MADKNKNRKQGRNTLSCQRYKLSKQRERNKLRRINRHLEQERNDRAAWDLARLLELELNMKPRPKWGDMFSHYLRSR